MGLAKANVIDAAGIEEQTSTIVLTIVDEMDWSDADAHLRALQDKINAYIAFIESGQMVQAYPDKTWSNVAIDIYPLYEYDSRIREILEKAAKSMADLDVQLRIRPHSGGA
ncbi:MAG: hypothetical protein JNK16_12315 [Phycisphaerales bacterium]|nr:hypothetical protein [Phycisphaerales bacterium]